MKKETHRKISILLHDLRGGGAERMTVRLATALMRRGKDVELVLVNRRGEFADKIPAGLSVVDLSKKTVLGAIPAIVGYLNRRKPDVLLTAMVHINIAGIIASKLSFTNSRVFATEHNQISKKAQHSSGLRQRLSYTLVKYLYRYAERVICVSHGVADDLANYSGLERRKISVIYNPIISDDLDQLMREPVDHLWLQGSGPPTLVAIGRMHRQKGFDILLEAMKIVNGVRDIRLVIVGTGALRAELVSMRDRLGLSSCVDFVGFQQNPYKFMKNSAAFVLSSRWEGMPTVLVEAMYCGAPVISTNCPSGPAEILDNGTYGAIVAVEDSSALADAILQHTKNPIRACPERARDFSVDKSCDNYLDVFGDEF